ARDAEAGDVLDERLGFSGREVPCFELRLRWGLAAGNPRELKRAFDGNRREKRFARDRFDLAIDSFGNRERDESVFDSVEINRKIRMSARFGRWFWLRLFLRFLGWFGLQRERIGQVFPQRDQIRAHPFWEPKIKMQSVINRIEFTAREEIQI